MIEISELWHSKSTDTWQLALDHYWSLVKDLELERNMAKLTCAQIEELDAPGWYHFLRDEYFRWKYTAPNRYATTTAALKQYIETDNLEELLEIRNAILRMEPADIRTSLAVVTQIRGLGVAGASGLLSLIYPEAFATVDQFVVKALRDVPDLPGLDRLAKMNPEGLTISDGIYLINVMRDKAKDNNQTFGGENWTPRKIDMILWATRSSDERAVV